ncbi:MAG: SIS domain-containing protein [Thermoguttaceae bacterium]
MLGLTLGADGYLRRLGEELDRVDRAAVERFAAAVYDAWDQGHFVFVIGNGGSAATASHLCEDVAKNILHPSDMHDDSKKRIRILSLTDNVSWITALSNDLCYEEIFAQQLRHFGSPGDLLVAISGSGNSPNILKAVEWANRQGLKTFGLTGFSGGKLKQLQHDGIHVAVDDMGMTESIHGCIMHWIVEEVEARVNSTGRYAQPAQATA